MYELILGRSTEISDLKAVIDEIEKQAESMAH